MNTSWLDKATFASVYRFLQNKEDSGTAKCFQNLFRISLLFFPAFICPDVALITNLSAGASLAGVGAGKAVKDAAKDAFSLFKNKSYEDYGTRYEQMQIAQVMLTYASYFDTISQYLPNENGEIELSPDVRQKLAQDALEAYCRELELSAKEHRALPGLLEEEIPLPDPTEDFHQYEKRLVDFYERLNGQFVKFFEQLPFWKSLDSSRDSLDYEQKEFFRGRLHKLPEQAMNTYRKQYFALAKAFPDFALWANLEEHRRIEKQIDIGFTHIAEQLRQCCYFMERSQNTAADAMERYQRKYIDYLKGPIIDHSPDFDTDGVNFPSKMDIFIPQSFKAITYRNNISLEKKDTWKDALSGEEIGQYIHSILGHPTYGQTPLLILGHPGAGKTLLCHMLAAQVLSAEYHVIIIRLRDTAAEDDITRQIDGQIARDLGESCRWSDIRNGKLDKPVLLIFDGYDELLQASGKTYANYLNEIAKFQSEQRAIHHMFVRCIVTSRVTLIDKASIPENSQVLHLDDFDDARIQRWTDIWNSKNESFFASHQINKLEIAPDGKVKELAGQPLLLLMLALFAMNGNDLREQANMSRAELYYRLIRDFVIRENEKDSGFCNLSKQKQGEVVYESLHRLGIAALGMYNRKKLVIRSAELRKDLVFLSGGEMPEDSTDAYELEEGDKLVGSFFFIHNSESMIRTDRTPVKVSAYEFLHNTFGEFLTAFYILDVALRLVRRQVSDAERGEVFSWPGGPKREWHTCLAYAPLFTRPVVLNMIHEFSPLLAQERNLDGEQVQSALDALFSGEIRRLISGKLFDGLNKTLSVQGNPYDHPELTVHVSTYSVNLILLRATVCTDSFEFIGRLGSESDWHKLTHLWRYAFSEGELVGLSCLLRRENKDQQYRLSYQYDEKMAEQTEAMSKLDRMYRVADVLGNDAEKAVFGALNKMDLLQSINHDIYPVLKREHLNIKTQYALNSIETVLTLLAPCEYRPPYLVKKMDFLLHCSCEELDYWGIYIYCSFLTALVERGGSSRKEINALLNQGTLFELERTINNMGRPFGNSNIGYEILYPKFLELAAATLPYLNYEELFDTLRYILQEVHPSIRRRSRYEAGERDTRDPVFQEQMSKLYSQYCKKVKEVLKKRETIYTSEVIDNLRETSDLFVRFISWKGLPSLLGVCETLQKMKSYKYVSILLGGYLDSMHDSLSAIFIRSKKKERIAFLSCVIECYYRMHLSPSQRPFVWDNSQIVKFISSKLDSLTMLLPSYDTSLYHLLWLLCCGEGGIPWLQFDLQSELHKVLTQHGSELSVQTLRQIVKCARKFNCQGLEDVAVQLILEK